MVGPAAMLLCHSKDRLTKSDTITLPHHQSTPPHARFVEKRSIAGLMIGQEQATVLIMKIGVATRYILISGNAQVVLCIPANAAPGSINREMQTPYRPVDANQ
jgi:hypothetical protein